MTTDAGLLAELRNGRRRLAAYKGWVRRRRQWEEYLAMHGHQDCFFAFLAILDDLDDEPPELYWRLLAETWSRNEMPAQHETLWRQLWNSPRLAVRRP